MTSASPILFDNHIGFARNSVEYFHYHDTKETFIQNLNKQPVDWKYRDSEEKLAYRFDDYGFRNDCNLQEISQGPYIVAAGCSPTMGTGQYFEETYPQHLERLVDIPVYNMGLGAASNEVNIFNVIWLLNNFKPPKAILFQKTAPNRFPIFHLKTPHDNEVIFAGPWVTSWIQEFHDLEKFMVLSDYYKYTELKNTMWQTILSQMCEKLGVLLIEFDMEEMLSSYGKQPDLARDMGHYGTEFNFHVASVLQDRLNEASHMR